MAQPVNNQRSFTGANATQIKLISQLGTVEKILDVAKTAISGLLEVVQSIEVCRILRPMMLRYLN